MADTHFQRLGLIVKPELALALNGVKRIMQWGKKNSVEILANNKTAGLLKTRGFDDDELVKMADGLIVLGGDGTLLGAARLATAESLPLLGINLGSLGFITEVAFDEIEESLDKLISGDYTIEERMMADLKISNAKDSGSNTALNDIFFSRKSTMKMIELSISVNGHHVSAYRADGLIISTPTGSTAYALSAGGPILYPLLDSLLICPICPHTLTNRPIVIPGDSIIDIDFAAGQEGIIATLDGQVYIDINENDRLTVGRSDRVTRFIKVPDRTHYDTLRSKLGWGGKTTSND
ncbi:MAG: NAD(+)/NADH kinase [Nitrospinota bacterium]